MNSRILITGATAGLGRAFYEQLKAEDVQFLLTGRNARVLQALSDERTEVHACDLTDEKERRNFLDRVRAWKPDTAIVCAGKGYIGFLAEMSDEEMRSLEALNERAFTELLRVLCDTMKAGGEILVVSSIGALLPGGPFQAVYYAQKAYQLSLTDALSMEYPDIFFSCLCPGPLDTGFHERAGGKALSGAMRPEVCARKALKGFRHHRRLIIPGLRNRMACVGARLLPRHWILGMTYHQIKKKKEGLKT